jgi:trigger factor
MIPGFEDEIIGKEPSEFVIKANFPEDYFKKDLAGSEASFEINLKTVQELTPAKIDEELFTKLEMEIKDSSKFKAEILSRMEKEVLSQEKDLTKESMYETLLKINSFSAPKVTIKEQAELMRKDSLMRIGQQDNEAVDDLFPLDAFMENA